MCRVEVIVRQQYRPEVQQHTTAGQESIGFPKRQQACRHPNTFISFKRNMPLLTAINCQMHRLSQKARLAASHRLFTASSVQDMHHNHQQPQQLMRKLQSAANQTGVTRLTGRSPRGKFTAQLDSQELIPGSSFAQYANDSRQHQLPFQPTERLTTKTRSRPQVAREASQNHTQPNAAQAGSQASAPADGQAASCGQSQHSVPHENVQATPQRVDIKYFHHIKSSLHSLIQAHHAIPTLHTMSEPDRAALTSILANKLDGVDVTAQVQKRFLPHQQQNVAQPAHEQKAAEQQPSAVSSVDCTPSPESVAQQQSSARHKQASRLLKSQHIPYGAFASACISNASHASAVSSGSGQRHSTHQHTHHIAKPDAEESFLNLLESCQNTADSLQHSLWQGRIDCNAGDFAVLSEADQDVLTFKESPKIDWSSSKCAATEHMTSRSCHTQAWDMQDCFAQFAEDENTDLFAQSPKPQQPPFAEAVDGPSAEEALFDRFQQDSGWLDTEQQQGTSVVVKPRSFQLHHKGHDMLGQPSCTSPRPDAELDRLFENKAGADSMWALDQYACRDRHTYGDSADKFLLPPQSTHQQAEMLLEADDVLAAEATDMNEHTISDLSALSEPCHDASHSHDCDLHALFSGHDNAFPKQARSRMFAQA
ncbi:hypothetical protein WJX77_005927 [Trebouxia sp. C0004]